MTATQPQRSQITITDEELDTAADIIEVEVRDAIANDSLQFLDEAIITGLRNTIKAWGLSEEPVIP